MRRTWAGVLVLALGGCAPAIKEAKSESARPYQAGVTYYMSAAALAQLAEQGQDVKFTIDMQAGGGQARSCTVAPIAPPRPKPMLLTLTTP